MSNVAIEEHHKLTYANTIKLLSQQTKSNIERHVTVQPCSGTSAVVADYYGSKKARKQTERFEKTKHDETPRQRRWLSPCVYYSAEKVEGSDILRILTDPKPALASVQIASLERAIDSEFFQQIFADAVQGQTPGAIAPASLPVGNNVAADFELSGTASGLGPLKLIEAVRQLISRYVQIGGADTPKVGINSKAWSDMFGQQTFTSGDYNKRDKPLADAPTDINYGGCDLVLCEHEDFPKNSTTELVLPCWVPSGVVLGKWSEVQVETNKIPDEVDSWEIKVLRRFAVTRTEEAKVVRIRIKQ